MRSLSISLVIASLLLTACTGDEASSVGGASAAGSNGATTFVGAGQAAGAEGNSSASSTPRVTVPSSSASGFAYSSASSADRRTFERVSKASGGLSTLSEVKVVRKASKAVGVVATYKVGAQVADSAIFREQYLVQLLAALTQSRGSAKYVVIDKTNIALVDAGGAAGWFQGNEVVLVQRSGKSTALTQLAAGVLRAPKGR